MFVLHKHSVSINECQWVPFFLYGEIQFHVFASSTLPCQMPFCQTALLLPPVAQQQNVTEYWWEGSASTVLPSTPASDVMGQQNETGGITFRAAFVDNCFDKICLTV